MKYSIRFGHGVAAVTLGKETDLRFSTFAEAQAFGMAKIKEFRTLGLNRMRYFVFSD